MNLPDEGVGIISTATEVGPKIKQGFGGFLFHEEAAETVSIRDDDPPPGSICRTRICRS